MRTRQRQSAKHEKPTKAAKPPKAEKPERPAGPERPAAAEKRAIPPLYGRFGALWMAAGILFALSAAALVALPLSLSWGSVAATATVSNVAGSGITGEAGGQGTFYLQLVEFLNSVGIKPRKAPWKPSGVDYGNTRMTAAAQAKPVYMAWQYRPKKLDAVPPGVNVLSPTWFYVESDGGVAVVNDLADLLDGKIAAWDPGQYILAAHNGGAEVWASVVCLSEPDLAKQIVSDQGRRSEFISRVAGWVREYGLDGINFDFEKMDPSDAGKFTDLVAETKRALPAGAVVSVDVNVPLNKPDPNNWWQCYDREGLGEAADFVAVMAYDNPDMEPVAAIGWVGDKVRQTLELVPQQKLLLGVPFYGVDFQFDAPKGTLLDAVPDYDRSAGRSTISPASVKSLLDNGTYPSGKKQISVNYWIEKGVWSKEKGITEYAFVDTDGKLHVIYCEDAESLAVKGELLAFDRLGGAAVWRMEFGSDPLWNSLYAGMTGAENQ